MCRTSAAARTTALVRTLDMVLGVRQKGSIATKDFLSQYELLDFRSRHSPLCLDIGFRL